MTLASPSRKSRLENRSEGAAAPARSLRYRIPIDRYHRMIETGALEEGLALELLDGQLVWKDRAAAGENRMTVGRRHAWVIRTLAELNDRLKKLGCCLQIQLPISLPPFNEPEPDAAILRGKKDDYRDRHPSAEDVLCVFEVSDSSLIRDRTRKLKAYAAANLPMYVIINLQDGVVEVCTLPQPQRSRYAQVVELSSQQKFNVPLANAKSLTLRARDLLP